jgi:dephospho-CoA kinase
MTHPDGIFSVVLTGGIASGKSAVSACFEALGTPVVDTDVIARQVVLPGSPALQRISAEFGTEYLDSNGGLDRRKMRKAIFSDPQLKSRLEAILHPPIGDEVKRQVGRLDAPYCVIVIPLYAETSSYDWVDRVLVVDVGEEEQIRRVMARDRISREQAHAILATQASRPDRLALADDVLDNSSGLSELAGKVRKLHEKYLALSLER